MGTTHPCYMNGKLRKNSRNISELRLSNNFNISNQIIKMPKTIRANNKISISIKKTYKKNRNSSFDIKNSNIKKLFDDISTKANSKNISKSEYSTNFNKKIDKDNDENKCNIIKKKIRNKSAVSLTRAHLSNNINDYNKGKLISEDKACKVFSGLGINGEFVTIREYINLSFNQKNLILENKKKIYNLNHPNILKVLYISEENNENMSIVYESSNLDNFENIINKYGTLNEKIIQVYGKQLLNGLQYLHRNNIYHKNLKLKNILVDNNATIKIANSLIDSLILGNENDIYNLAINSNNIEYYIPPFFIKNILKNNHDENINNNDKILLDFDKLNEKSNLIKDNMNEFWQSFDLWYVGCILIEIISGKNPWPHYIFKNNLEFFKFLNTPNLNLTLPKKISLECSELIQTLLNPSLTKMNNIYEKIFNLNFFKKTSNNLTYNKALMNISNSFNIKKSINNNNDSNFSDSGAFLGQILANNKVLNLLNNNNNPLYSVSFSNEDSSFSGSKLFSSILSNKKNEFRNKVDANLKKIKTMINEMPVVKELQNENSPDEQKPKLGKKYTFDEFSKQSRENKLNNQL